MYPRYALGLTSNDHAPSPPRRPSLAVQAPETPPIQMKCEQESPPLFSAQRRAVPSPVGQIWRGKPIGSLRRGLKGKDLER